MSVEAVPAPIREPAPQLVAALEDILDRARRGEVVGFACVFEASNGIVDHILYGQPPGNAYKMVGALSALTKKAIAQWLE